MLTYLNAGERDYYSEPVTMSCRHAWEFQAVLSGAITAVGNESGRQTFYENRLWVSPPESQHGWVGLKDRKAHILVFHFSYVADELRRLCKREGPLSLAINDDEKSQIRGIYNELHSEYTNMGKLYSLRARSASDRLSLFVCSRLSHLIPPSESEYEINMVENAIFLFTSEMESSVSVREICQRLGISESHMRRLFHRVRGAGPRSVLETIRMERAREMCTLTGDSFAAITRACGFAEQSSFTKAYCRFWNQTPTDSRKSAKKY